MNFQQLRNQVLVNDHTYGVLTKLAISLSAWSIIYILFMQISIPKHKAAKSSEGKSVELSEIEKIDVYNRMISFLHGLAAWVLSFIYVVFWSVPYGGENTPLQNFILIMGFGYFLFNTISMTYYKLLDSSMAFHHVVVWMVYFVSIYDNQYGAELITGVYFTEISNPPMHFRLFLKTFGLRHTKSYELSELAYILLYSYHRSYLAAFLLRDAVISQTWHILIKIVFAIIIFKHLINFVVNNQRKLDILWYIAQKYSLIRNKLKHFSWIVFSL